MMKQYTYTLVLFFTIIICFIASFDRRIRFNRFFGNFLLAAIVVAVPFIAWDIWFTKQGVWWFNTSYTMGILIAGLPIEEWLFFICIPFSCVFTYFCLDKYFKWASLSSFNNILVFVLVIIFSVAGLLYQKQIYSLVTAMATVGTLLYLHFVVRAEWITKATVIYLILMLGFFPVNGVLTGTGLQSPIVNYNPKDFIGFRMLTIPIEDAVYGYTQFLLVIYFFQLFTKDYADTSLFLTKKS